MPRASRLSDLDTASSNDNSDHPDATKSTSPPPSSSAVWQKAQRRRTNPGKGSSSPSGSPGPATTAAGTAATGSNNNSSSNSAFLKVRASTATAASAPAFVAANAAPAAHKRAPERRGDLLDDDGDGVLLRYSRAEDSSQPDYDDGDLAMAAYVGKSSRNATNTTANSANSRSSRSGDAANNNAHDEHPSSHADHDDGASDDDSDDDGTANLAMSSQLMAKLKLGRSIDAAAVEPKRVGSGMLRVGDVANGLHCNECGLFCADDHVLFVHKQQVHKTPTVTVGNSAATSSSGGVPRKATSPQPAALRCGLCQKTMSTKAELDAHVEKHETDLGLKDVATTTLGALYGLSKAGDAAVSAGRNEKVSLGALSGPTSRSPNTSSSGSTASDTPPKKTKKKLFGSSGGAKQKSSEGKK